MKSLHLLSAVAPLVLLLGCASSGYESSRAEESFQAAATASEEMLSTGEGVVSYLSDIRTLLFNDLTPRGVSGAADLVTNAKASTGKLHQVTQPALNSLKKASEALSTR